MQLNKGEEIILIGLWDNPDVTKAYYLFSGLIHEAVTKKIEIVEFAQNHSNEELLSIESFRLDVLMVWKNQIVKNDKNNKIWNCIRRKIIFYKEKEDYFKKYFPEYWKFYENQIITSDASFIKIYFKYYMRKYYFNMKIFYFKTFAPIIYLLFHDVINLLQIVPNLVEVRNKIKIEKLKLRKISDSFYSQSQKETFSQIVDYELSKNIQLESTISKQLSEINKNIITVTLSTFAVVISLFTAYKIYVIKNMEINELKEKERKLMTIVMKRDEEIGKLKNLNKKLK
ncbi:hypothetical protein [Leptospira stimsonii]|uniref:Uncharacterized protein n=1 Tax=Leptospira stimsonii TaxID=2202203 RepID=A0A396YN50_9LEPT|nr:hypothetical protein [Leptospira stimsonii]RHX83623.1 hypothetical protein DLM75_23850 [Leptospira stimsonii]